jgi:catechol 2,3-dioxygenase-like lactoylglutathione lyase family enzyme
LAAAGAASLIFTAYFTNPYSKGSVMSQSDNARGIRAVGRVLVPVTDQDRSLDFYTRVLGFEVRTDAVAEESGRWLEVAPRGAQTTIVIVPPRGGMWGSPGVDTRISLTSEDIDGDHAALVAEGADVDDSVMRIGGPVPPFFFFRDPDGNTLQVVQADQ